MTARIQYIADGTQGRFIFAFTIFRDGELEVYVETRRQGPDDFAIIPAGAEDWRRPEWDRRGSIEGGSVSFRHPPPAGALVTLRRRMPLERAGTLPPGVPHAAALNAEFNRVAAGLEQLADDIALAVTLSPGCPGGGPVLPAPAPGRALVWNDDGSALVNGSSDLPALERHVSQQAGETMAGARRAEDAARAADTAARGAKAAGESVQAMVDGAGRKIAAAADKAAATAGSAAGLLKDAANPRRAFFKMNLLNIW